MHSYLPPHLKVTFEKAFSGISISPNQSLISHSNFCSFPKNCCAPSFKTLPYSLWDYIIWIYYFVKLKKRIAHCFLYVHALLHSFLLWYSFSWSMLYCDKTPVTIKFRMLIHFSTCLFDTFLCRFQNTKTKRFNWSKIGFLSSFFKTNYYFRKRSYHSLHAEAPNPGINYFLSSLSLPDVSLSLSPTDHSF